MCEHNLFKEMMRLLKKTGGWNVIRRFMTVLWQLRASAKADLKTYHRMAGACFKKVNLVQLHISKKNTFMMEVISVNKQLIVILRYWQLTKYERFK